MQAKSSSWLSLTNLGVFLLLAISSSFFCTYNSGLRRHHGLPHDLSGLQPVTETTNVYPLSTNSPRSIGLPFGNEHYSPNFSYPSPGAAHPHAKRALDIYTAICTGRKLWQMLQDEYNRPRRQDEPFSNGRVFTQGDIDNGWTSYSDIARQGAGSVWDEPFKSIAGGRTSS